MSDHEDRDHVDASELTAAEHTLKAREFASKFASQKRSLDDDNEQSALTHLPGESTLEKQADNQADNQAEELPAAETDEAGPVGHASQQDDSAPHRATALDHEGTEILNDLVHSSTTPLTASPAAASSLSSDDHNQQPHKKFHYDIPSFSDNAPAPDSVASIPSVPSSKFSDEASAVVVTPAIKTEIMTISCSGAGSLIGKGGENIERIKNTSGASINISQKTFDNAPRTVTLSGLVENVDCAREMIKNMLDPNVIIENPVPVQSMGGHQNQHPYAQQHHQQHGQHQHQHQSYDYNRMASSGGAHHDAYGSSPASSSFDPKNIVSGPDYMLIPYRRIGLIIGKGGERIRDFISKSDCHIQVAQVPDRSDTISDRTLNFSGTPENIERAKSMIIEFLETTEAQRAGGPAGGASSHATFEAGLNTTLQNLFAEKNQGNYPPSFVRDDMQVLARHVGLVLGQSGQNIKNLQSEYNVHIQIGPAAVDPNNTASAPNPDPSATRTFYFFGESENIASLKDRITQNINEYVSNPQSRPHRQNNNAAGASAGGMSSMMHSHHNPHQMQQQYPSHQGNRQSVTISIPAQKCGAIIGRGGEKIKWLMNMTGARIRFENTVNPITNTKEFRIDGTPEQIMAAQTMISQKITEIPSNPLHGAPGPASYSPASQYGAGSAANAAMPSMAAQAQNPYMQNAMSAYYTNPAYAAYYANYAAAAAASAPGAVAPGASPTDLSQQQAAAAAAYMAAYNNTMAAQMYQTNPMAGAASDHTNRGNLGGQHQQQQQQHYQQRQQPQSSSHHSSNHHSSSH